MHKVLFKKTVLIALIIALIASFSFYFICENKWSIERKLGFVPRVEDSSYYYAQESWLRSLDSLKINPEIVFIGDSIISQGKWQKYFPQKRICNLGMSGDVSFNLAYRAKIIKKWNPEKIFILVGVNDMSRIIDPVGNFSRDYKEMLKNIASENPNSQIFCISILPVSEKSLSKNQLILKANKEISKIANENSNVAMLDIHKSFCDSSGMMSKKYTRDGIHLNEEGYAIFAGSLSKFVK